MDPNRFDDPLKGEAEFAIPIMNQETPRFQKAKFFHGHVACDLRNPALVRMRRDSCDMNLPTADPNKKKEVKSDQSVQDLRFRGEEIASKQKILMGSNELPPGRCLLPLRCRGQAISLQNISQRVVAHLIAKIGHNPQL